MRVPTRLATSTLMLALSSARLDAQFLDSLTFAPTAHYTAAGAPAELPLVGPLSRTSGSASAWPTLPRGFARPERSGARGAPVLDRPTRRLMRTGVTIGATVGAVYGLVRAFSTEEHGAPFPASILYVPFYALAGGGAGMASGFILGVITRPARR